jgi:hypothetical protein
MPFIARSRERKRGLMYRYESFERGTAGQSYPVTEFDASQIKTLVRTLSRALGDEPRFAWVMPNEETRGAILPLFFASAIRVSEAYGEAFITPSADGAALWIRPGGVAASLRMLRDELQQLPVKLRTASVRRSVRVGACLERIYERLGRRPHWHLLTLGVSAGKERETTAAALITPVLSRADSEGLSCSVETFEERDLPFYERHGFRIEGSGRISASGPNFWVMMRAPRS